MAKRYSPRYKKRICHKIARNSSTVSELNRQTGISKSTLYNWKKEYRVTVKPTESAQVQPSATKVQSIFIRFFRMQYVKPVLTLLCLAMLLSMTLTVSGMISSTGQPDINIPENTTPNPLLQITNLPASFIADRYTPATRTDETAANTLTNNPVDTLTDNITDDEPMTSATLDFDISTLSAIDIDLYAFPYLIYISKETFTIAILGLDESGEYTQVIHTFRTATGRTSAMTRAGTYQVTSRVRWIVWGGSTYTPYGTGISGGLWFHGPIYNSMNNRNLRVSSYNAIGTAASGGCLRTTSEASAWIYHNIPEGTTVIIANDAKYTSPDIPELGPSQRYDPTDPEIVN